MIWLSARTTCRLSLTDLRAALDDCFALSKADATSHPFVTATVLNPATKPCELFPESQHFAAYGHVRELMSEAAASLQAETDGGALMRVHRCQSSAPRWTAGRRRRL